MKKWLLTGGLVFLLAFPCFAAEQSAAPSTPGQKETAMEKALQEEKERSEKYGVSFGECLSLVEDGDVYEDLSPLPPASEPMDVLNSMVLDMSGGRVKSVNMVLRSARKAKDAAKIEIGKPTMVFHAVDTVNVDVKPVKDKEAAVAIEFVGAHRKECSKLFTYVLRCYIRNPKKNTYTCVDAEDLAKDKIKINSLEDFLKAPQRKIKKGSRDWEIAEMIFHKEAKSNEQQVEVVKK
ncbi:MAG: hypothetical protein LKE33_04450 [Acidaminococcus sp.]|jgi:hypothetical protein|nr:hypothetical protein [Acidaminococcus sp.]MCI2100461.1 hypothetical protein [Acidaminococcus sp.]MCI2114782.1 hypothetical protein [Acidaminococcus sp.]MCI2116835.1 hypothetical protein [Acidaminococcus sp.]